jgi:diphthamide synthase subunit DPH2
MKNTQEVNLCCSNKFLSVNTQRPLFYGDGAFVMLGGRAKAMKSFLLRIDLLNKAPKIVKYLNLEIIERRYKNGKK